jgi:hypothetical protein
MTATSRPVGFTLDRSGRQPWRTASSVMYFSTAADRHRAEAVVERAGALAQAVLRADAAADLGQRIGLVAQLGGLEQVALVDQLQPVGDVVVHRALPLAVRVAAVDAARRTGRRLVGLELPVDLAEPHDPRLRRSACAGPDRDFEELKSYPWAFSGRRGAAVRAGR